MTTADLRLGRWQDTLTDVECDALITDPPYSARTHEGQRTGSSIRMPTIGYQSITQDDAQAFAAEWSKKTRWWAVIFCDHLAFQWHEAAWAAAGWLVFAPLLVKVNPTPRFSGDGPAFGLEFIMAARRRTSKRKSGSLPAYYETMCGFAGEGQRSIVPGAKQVDVMRAIIRDYSRPGDVICDPCAGGGTTLIAALIEGRSAIGSEMDPKTHALAMARIKQGHTPDMFSNTEG
jgi:site-specific DNA-methyltransferase (adenine-specific)